MDKKLLADNYTKTDHFATMEGAVLSGKLAAQVTLKPEETAI
ncbi:FAD-dependent oxidoreductase [Bacillus thermotolerans]